MIGLQKISGIEINWQNVKYTFIDDMTEQKSNTIKYFKNCEAKYLPSKLVNMIILDENRCESVPLYNG